MKPHSVHTGHFMRQLSPYLTDLAATPEPSPPAPLGSKPTPDRPEFAAAANADADADADAERIMVLSENERLTIVDSHGQPFLEIAAGGTGPSIRIVHDDLRIECSGKLDFSAQAITMTAHEDVTVKGKTIRLN